MKRITKFIGVAAFSLILLGTFFDSTDSTDSTVAKIDYEIISDESKRNIKRSVTVMLDHRISEQELTDIANDIYKDGYERTFISYKISDDRHGGYWAQTYFDPTLEVMIYGGTDQDYRDALAKPSPKKSTFRDFMSTNGDFSEEQGSLKIHSESPLKFSLGALNAHDQLHKYKIESVRKAAIYGVYRTFIHTNEESVDITAYAIDIESFNPYKATENHNFDIHFKVSRRKALDAVKALMPDVSSFDDLVTFTVSGGRRVDGLWTEDFLRNYYSAQSQEKLISLLSAF